VRHRAQLVDACIGLGDEVAWLELLIWADAAYMLFPFAITI